MDDQNRCRGCGEERPPDAPAGLCPVCLFRAGQNGDTAADDHDEDGARRPAILAHRAGLTELLSGSSVARKRQRRDDHGRAVMSFPAAPDGFISSARSVAAEWESFIKGRDSDLGRELAVKVLLERYRDHPAMIRRFIEEAQISGQLQHPGVVPVYEIGVLSDHRPYFAMKLIKGRTLAELLAGRSDAEDNLPRLLSIFEAVCQTVAYAHARGVIHRDLKPSNIMVGSFGEVQVMDWGAAKLLGQHELTARPAARGAPASKRRSSRTGRSRSGHRLTREPGR